MNSFLDKFKEGINQTGKQAKVVVDTNRLKMQISMKQKEIESKYTDIGKLVFTAYSKNDFSMAENELQNHCKEVLALQEAIKDIEKNIQELNDEKVCVCGKTVPSDTRFCSFCGHKFQENEATAINTFNKKICICGKAVPVDSKFCPICGHGFAEEEQAVAEAEEMANDNELKEKVCVCGKTLPVDTKFCYYCGHGFQK